MSTKREEWRPVIINGIRTNYIVSNEGNIYNTKISKELTLTPGTHGYVRINLYVNGKPHRVSVHRLVAEAFIHNDDPDTKNEINHIDGNKENNRVDNLEWVTPKENIHHAINTGLIKRQVSDDNLARLICEGLSGGLSTSFLAKTLGISPGVIEAIKRGKQYHHISKHYNFHKMSRDEIIEKNNKSRANANDLNIDLTFPDKIYLYDKNTDIDPTNTEVWSERLVIGKSGKKSNFRISSFGRVMNEKTCKILIPRLSHNGFLRIGLYNPDIQQTKYFTVHVLVASIFLYNANPEWNEVDFIDGNKLNCRVSNLKWVSTSDRMTNNKEYLKHGNKLNEMQVKEICEMIVDNQLTNKEIAQKYGVSHDIIEGIRCGRRWKAISKDYSFPSKREFKSNFAKRYPEIDRLILQGYRNKDIVNMLFDVNEDNRISLRNTISNRKRLLKDKGILK